MDDAKETLNRITALATKDQVGDREAALQLMQLGRALQGALLRQLEVKELHTHPAYARIQRINFWPWSGSLEVVVQEIGKEYIFEHWNKCIEQAKHEVEIVSEVVAERAQSQRAVAELAESNKSLVREVKKLTLKQKAKKLLGMGKKKEKKS